MAFSRDLLEVALPFPAGVDMHDIWLGQLCERVGKTAFVPVTTNTGLRNCGSQLPCPLRETTGGYHVAVPRNR